MSFPQSGQGRVKSLCPHGLLDSCATPGPGDPFVVYLCECSAPGKQNEGNVSPPEGTRLGFVWNFQASLS